MSVSKTTVGVAGLVAMAASIGLFWQLRTNSRLRDEVDALRQQNVMTALLQAENNRLTQARTRQTAEVVRLQTELTQLADRVTEVTARAGSTGGGRTGQVTADATTDTTAGAIVQGASLEGRYAALFKQLGLDAGGVAKFKKLLVAKQQAAEDAVAALLAQGIDVNQKMPMVRDAVAAAQAPVNTQIQTEIGETAFGRYRRYEDTLPQRNTIEQLSQMLSPTPTPLTPDQTEQMVSLLEKTHEPEGKGGPGRLLDGNMNYHSKISAVTITQAAEVLSTPQVEMLKNLQQFQRGGSRR